MMADEIQNLDDEITSDGDRLVTLKEAESEFAAGLIVATLKEAGIEAVAFGAIRLAYPFDARGGQIPVQVRARDEEAAREALAKRAEDSVDIDWDEVDVGEREDDGPLSDVTEHTTPQTVALGILVAFIAAALIIAMLVALF